MSFVQELQDLTRSAAEAAAPSVVGIGRGIRGAGVVVADGIVLTNTHNLRGGEVTVTFDDGTRTTGRVGAVDADGDLAVVQVDTAGASPPAWADAPPGLGTVVFGVARAGDGRLRITAGLVSATERSFRGPRGRRLGGAFEHTAPLARGSSGGPVLDTEGRLVGLNTHRMGDGFYLALAAGEALRARVDTLVAGEAPRRHSLGIAVAPPHVARKLRRSVGLPEREGLLVRGVDPDGPAARAGLESGDLLVRANGRDLGGVDDLHAALDALGGADTIDVVVVRGVEERAVRVSFGAGAPAQGEA